MGGCNDFEALVHDELSSSRWSCDTVWFLLGKAGPIPLCMASGQGVIRLRKGKLGGHWRKWSSLVDHPTPLPDRLS